MSAPEKSTVSARSNITEKMKSNTTKNHCNGKYSQRQSKKANANRLTFSEVLTSGTEHAEKTLESISESSAPDSSRWSLPALKADSVGPCPLHTSSYQRLLRKRWSFVADCSRLAFFSNMEKDEKHVYATSFYHAFVIRCFDCANVYL